MSRGTIIAIIAGISIVGIAITLAASLMISTSPQSKTAPLVKTTDINQFKVYKIGKSNVGESMMSTLGVSPVEGLPDEPDRYTVIIFDEASDYIRTNMDELEFRGKISESIFNHAKLVSIAGDQSGFAELMSQASGQGISVPDTGSRLNGKDMPDAGISAIGYTQKPPDAMCSTHNPENPDEVASCAYRPSTLGAEAYLEDGSVDIQTLNQLFLRWLGDE